MTPRLRASEDGEMEQLDEKITNLPEQRPGRHNHEHCFFTVKSEEVRGHPSFFNSLRQLTVEVAEWKVRC